MPCKVSGDQHGSLYIVPAYTPATRKHPHIIPRPELQVWWDRDAKNKANEDLIIRQENGADGKADVIQMAFGQVYDLIDALNKLVQSR